MKRLLLSILFFLPALVWAQQPAPPVVQVPIAGYIGNVIDSPVMAVTPFDTTAGLSVKAYNKDGLSLRLLPDSLQPVIVRTGLNVIVRFANNTKKLPQGSGYYQLFAGTQVIRAGTVTASYSAVTLPTGNITALSTLTSQVGSLSALITSLSATAGVGKLDVTTYNTNRPIDQAATAAAQSTANTALSTANSAQTAASAAVTAASSATALATQAILGTIYSNSALSSLTGFTNNGATVSASGSGLSFSGGNAGYTQTLEYNYYTALSKWEQSIQFTADQKTSGSYGTGIGIRASNSGNYSNLVQFDMSSGASSGKISLVTGANAYTTTSSSAISFSAGDLISLSLERRGDVLIGTAYNVTTSSAPVSVSTVFAIPTATYNLPHSTGRFAIYSVGGNFTVKSLTIRSKEIIRPKLVIVGDSKTQGYFATNYGTSWARKVATQIPGTVILAGAGDKSIDVINRLPEILSLAPRQVLLAIGTNDGASPVAVTSVNVPSIVSALESAGITVRMLDAIYDTYNASALASYYNSTYPGKVIQTYTKGAATPGSLNADNVHPSQTGHDVVYNEVMASPLLQFQSPTPSLLESGDVNVTGGNILVPYNSIQVGSSAGVATASPKGLDLGGSFFDMSSAVSNGLKLQWFNVGGTARAGITQSGFGTEQYTYSGTQIRQWIGTSPLTALTSSGLSVTGTVGATAGISSGGDILPTGSSSIGSVANPWLFGLFNGGLYSPGLVAWSSAGTYMSNNAGTSKLKMFDSGNVVLGGTTPVDNGLYKLQVAGAVNASAGFVGTGGTLTSTTLVSPTVSGTLAGPLTVSGNTTLRGDLLPNTGSVRSVGSAGSPFLFGLFSGSVFTPGLTAWSTSGVNISNNAGTQNMKLFDSGNFVLGSTGLTDNGIHKLQVNGGVLSTSLAVTGATNTTGTVNGATPTEMGYLSGVTSGIQSQINSKQATLVSGTNIKTVGGVSLLGSGDVSVGSTYTPLSLSSNASASGTLSWAWSTTATSIYSLTTSGNITLSNPTNLTVGQTGTLMIVLGGTGHTLTFGANYVWPNATTPIFPTTSGSVIQIRLFSNGTNVYAEWVNPVVAKFGGVALSTTNANYGGMVMGAPTGSGGFIQTYGGSTLQLNPAGNSVDLSGGGSLTVRGGGSVVIGSNTTVASSLLTMVSTTQGFLPPRMTAAQRTAIPSPATGLIVYQTDGTEGVYIYKSTGWVFAF